MSVSINQKTGMATVTAQLPNGGTVEKSGTVDPPEGATAFVDAPCNVGVSLGHTKALKQFENIKFQVSLHMPCTAEEIDQTYDFVKDWVDNKLGDLVDEITESMKG